MRKLLILIATTLGIGACSSVPRIVTEYRIDVQQGNVLTQDAVAQLRPGLTQDQVRFILGTPMLADVFHSQRWDYVYRYQNGVTNDVQARRFSVFFNNEGRLARVEGDVAVAQVSDLNIPQNRAQEVELGRLGDDAPPVPEVTPAEEGVWGRLMNKIGL